VLAEVSAGADALQATETLRPDVVIVASSLLDMTGLEAVSALRDRSRRRAVLVIVSPQVRKSERTYSPLVFWTISFDRSKPTPSRRRSFARAAVFGARKQTTQPAASMYLAAAVHSRLQCDRPSILIAEREQRLYPIQPRRIDYVESAGNYVKFHVDRCGYIARESIKRLEVALADAGFVRIERRLLLNILAISFVETVGHGAFAFTLNNGLRLHSGPAYRETILRALPLRRRACGVGGEREHNFAAGTTNAVRA
jgi:two-component system LytT family response regulator